MIQTKQNKINLARNKRKLLNIKMSIIYFSYQSLWTFLYNSKVHRLF